MDSRERLAATLNFKEPDRLCVDCGAGYQTGMHVSMVYKLRQALALDEPGTPVKVIEPYQMLGEIAADLLDILGMDVVSLRDRGTMFGFPPDDWKQWEALDGTPVLVPGLFNTEVADDGSLYQYPGGDRSAPPSGHMPRGGFYFDAVPRGKPVDDANLRVEDNTAEFGLLSDEDVDWWEVEADRLYCETDRGIYATLPGTAFGDIALVPVPWMKDPKGIRGIEDWYISIDYRRDFVYKVFEKQCEIALQNLAKIHAVVGDKIDVVFVSGTDFGMQQGPFLPPQSYCDLFRPFHREINNWIHRNTKWKTFIHSCGSIRTLIPHIIEAGFDILNPVQCSAADMDVRELKDNYGDRVVFWGGGVNTQQTLPFGTPEDVRKEVRERIDIFSKGGGFVFNSIHNIQPLTPIENLLAYLEEATGKKLS